MRICFLKFAKENKLITLLLFLSMISLGIGLYLLFVKSENLYLNSNNDGFVSAFFSLTGVFAFFSALYYQIKEYKNQLQEMKLSVEAQTKSSEALNGQNSIMIRQNSMNSAFALIDYLNEFKKNNSVKNNIDEPLSIIQDACYLKWKHLDFINNANKEQVYSDFSCYILNIVNDVFSSCKQHFYISRLVTMAYNVLYFIDQNGETLDQKYFKALFLSQLNTEETVLIRLSNFIQFGFGQYDNLEWDYHCTSETINWLLKFESHNHIYTGVIEISEFTNRFEKFRQQAFLKN